MIVCRIQVSKRPVHEAMFVGTRLVERPHFIELGLIACRIVAEIDHHQHAVAGSFRNKVVAPLVLFYRCIISAFLVLVLQIELKGFLQLRCSFSLVRKNNTVPTIIGILRIREIDFSLRKPKSKQTGKSNFNQTIHTNSYAPRAVKSI